MCARTVLVTSSLKLVDFFRRLDPQGFDDLLAQGTPDTAIRFHNLAPTDPIVALRRPPPHPHEALWSTSELELAVLRWGLVPGYQWRAAAGQLRRPLINARDDKLTQNREWRRALEKGRRALVPLDGWTEWTGDKGDKQPWWFRPLSDRPLALAGLWAPWSPPDRVVREIDGQPWCLRDSLTLITTDASPQLAPFHDRSPVILPEAAWQAWLDPETPVDQALGCLGPVPEGWIEVVALDRAIGDARRKDPGVRRVLSDPVKARDR